MVSENEFVGQVTSYTVRQIEVRLREAHVIATNARSFSAEGLEERSVETLLDIEPVIYEAKTLLDAITVVRRERAG